GSEQVDLLPLPGRVVSAQRSDPGGEDLLVQVLREAVLRLALGGPFPVRREQTDDGFAPGARLAQRVLPSHARLNPGVRVQVQEDLVGQRWLLTDQPLP